IVLISDGQDNASKHTFKELQDLLRKSDITLYSLFLIYPDDRDSALGREGEDILKELPAVTGGRTLMWSDTKQLDSAVSVIAAELHHQYRIGFRGASDSTKKWHRIRLNVVKTNNQEAKPTVRTRQTYSTN